MSPKKPKAASLPRIEANTGRAAAILGVSVEVVIRLCKAGVLKARLMPRGFWMIDEESLLDYASRRRAILISHIRSRTEH